MKTKAAAGSEKATEICCHPADLPPQAVHAKACAQVGRDTCSHLHPLFLGWGELTSKPSRYHSLAPPKKAFLPQSHQAFLASHHFLPISPTLPFCYRTRREQSFLWGPRPLAARAAAHPPAVLIPALTGVSADPALGAPQWHTHLTGGWKYHFPHLRRLKTGHLHVMYLLLRKSLFCV